MHSNKTLSAGEKHFHNEVQKLRAKLKQCESELYDTKTKNRNLEAEIEKLRLSNERLHGLLALNDDEIVALMAEANKGNAEKKLDNTLLGLVKYLQT